MDMNYQPVVAATTPPLRATALVGAHTVVLGFDLLDTAATTGLLGFAVQRTALAANTTVWLKNPLKFARQPYVGYKIGGTDSNQAPFQQFHWIDELVEPEHDYRYTIFTVFGTPAQPELRAHVEVALRTAAPAQDALGLFFNRGVTATPAYRQPFDNLPPNKQPPDRVSAAEHYLARGLQDALLAFIAGAAAGDQLDIAIYEFQHASVVAALAAAMARGVSVRLVAHARPDKTAHDNAPFLAQLQQAATASGGQLTIVPRRAVPGLSHNKAIVHRRAGVPLRVWTGSTNFSESGFFLQTNVGMALDDPALAQAYAEYLDLLMADPPAPQLRAAVDGLVAAQPWPPDQQVFFAPVGGDAMLQAAAAMIRAARDVVILSCPFGLDPILSDAIHQLPPRVLVYGILNTNQRGDIRVLDRDPQNVHEFVVPDWIRELNGSAYDASTGRGNQVHVKALVVDPWGDAPQVLIGSANFSDESVTRNDENMLLLNGNRRAAALVATECLRVFMHYRFRNHLKALAQAYDTSVPPPQPPGVLGTATSPMALDDVWLVPPEAVMAGDGGAGAGALLGFRADDIWLAENDAWLRPATVAGSMEACERAVFAPEALHAQRP